MIGQDIKELLEECLQDVEEFYRSSFLIRPQQCVPYIAAFTEKTQRLSTVFTEKQLNSFKLFLTKMLEAMQNQDYVLVRDCLYYELKPWLKSLSVKGLERNQRDKHAAKQ